MKFLNHSSLLWRRNCKFLFTRYHNLTFVSEVVKIWDVHFIIFSGISLNYYATGSMSCNSFRYFLVLRCNHDATQYSSESWMLPEMVGFFSLWSKGLFKCHVFFEYFSQIRQSFSDPIMKHIFCPLILTCMASWNSISSSIIGFEWHAIIVFVSFLKDCCRTRSSSNSFLKCRSTQYVDQKKAVTEVMAKSEN